MCRFAPLEQLLLSGKFQLRSQALLGWALSFSLISEEELLFGCYFMPFLGELPKLQCFGVSFFCLFFFFVIVGLLFKISLAELKAVFIITTICRLTGEDLHAK